MIIIKHLGCNTVLNTINDMPDFSCIKEPTLSILQKAWEEGNFEILNDPQPISEIKNPDWEGLATKVLEGELLPLFSRLTTEAINSNAISIARNDITLAVTVIRNESALASSLALLQQLGFVFTEEEKQLWNNVVEKLGFSLVVQI